MTKRTAIIGGGLAGLSAGIYLQQSGVQTEIFEISGQPGGMCIAWERKGYWFDGCINWMVGTRQDNGFYKMYLETGALSPETEIYNAPFIRVEVAGKMLDIPMQADAFETFLLGISPEDEKPIKVFCRKVRRMSKTTMPTGIVNNVSDLLHMTTAGLGFLSLAGPSMGVTVGDYATRFKCQAVREILYNLMPPDFSLFALIMMLGTRMGGDAGYPIGGARDVIKRMTNKYLSLGGTLHLSTKVDRIEVAEGKATAVHANGVRYPADAVIAACDMYDTIYRMLDGQYRHPQLEAMLRDAPLFDPLCIVSFGLYKKLGLPYSVNYSCKDEISCAGERGTPDYQDVHGFSINAFEFDPTAAPDGHTSVMMLMGAPLDYWQNLRDTDMAAYRARKAQLADEAVQAMERRVPGFADAVAVVDVATPATYVRYANLYKGSWEGFAPTAKTVGMQIKPTIDGVKGLTLAGQWVSVGGGICTAVASGHSAAMKTLRYLR